LTQLVGQSKALCHENKRLLTTCRFLIAANRRLLNPYWASQVGPKTMIAEGALLLSVRSRLERGLLIPAPHQGTGKTCVICAQKI